MRWARLRFTFFPLTVLFIEPFLECTPCAFAAGFGMNYLFGFGFVNYILFHYAVWITLDYIMLRIVQVKLVFTQLCVIYCKSVNLRNVFSKIANKLKQSFLHTCVI